MSNTRCSGSNESGPRNSYEKNDLIIRESGEDDDISLYLDGESGEIGNKNVAGSGRNILGVQTNSNEDGKDGIAEPLYTLMGEVFDMRGVFKWLRKTLISFVQITYGRTINRYVDLSIYIIYSIASIYKIYLSIKK